MKTLLRNHCIWIVKLQRWQVGTRWQIVISASGLSDVYGFKNDGLKGELVEPFCYGLTFLPLFHYPLHMGLSQGGWTEVKLIEFSSCTQILINTGTGYLLLFIVYIPDFKALDLLGNIFWLSMSKGGLAPLLGQYASRFNFYANSGFGPWNQFLVSLKV
jgi:hypothetical protein